MTTQTQTTRATGEFIPAPYAEPHVRRQMDDLLAEVAEAVAPVWPLADYVAVNPFAGLTSRSFADARSYLRVFSDTEMLMPLAYFAGEYEKGTFTRDHIEQAIRETDSQWDVAAVLDYLGTFGSQSRQWPSGHRPVKTMAEYAEASSSVDWTAIVRDEIGKTCGAHYDQGQAGWAYPWKDLSLFHAWRSAAVIDRNAEIAGISGFRELVGKLPHTADAAIEVLLIELEVPRRLWSTFLLCQAFSIPGWSAWAKYQTHWKHDSGEENDDFIGLLAIRLAYDVALAKTLGLSVNWESITSHPSASFDTPASASDDAELRGLLLHAMEVTHRNGMIRSLTAGANADQSEDATARKLAQMVFCIDVRSERFRRQLEAISNEVETFGFAGFFGIPLEFVPLGDQCGTSQVPVLLKPQFRAYEGIRDGSTKVDQLLDNKRASRSWRGSWKSFQRSAVSCFSAVETTGLAYALTLVQRVLGKGKASNDDLPADVQDQLGPTLRDLNHQDVTTSSQVDMVESMLRNLGLTDGFARLVVFCGHHCQTENNPLAASLDCGACGGHSGEPNARMAALLCNQPYIRASLEQRGIAIPADTHFVAATHNTTTDKIKIFDACQIPGSHQGDLDELKSFLRSAELQTRAERSAKLDADEGDDLLRRAVDWSEVRPEWGLAGNASFIVGPRSLTKHVDLDGKAFLHSYDHRKDADGAVLETIMTAPMVVANWINLQYYASVVDPKHFGSGSKTIHNVVGEFGVFSGNGGDLQTGLPHQSLHNGRQWEHTPLRLNVVIVASRSAIDTVISKHESVRDLVTGSWLHLVAIDDGQAYRYRSDGNWEHLSVVPPGLRSVSEQLNSTAS